MLHNGEIALSFFYGNYESNRTSSYICLGNLRENHSYNYVDLKQVVFKHFAGTQIVQGFG